MKKLFYISAALLACIGASCSSNNDQPTDSNSQAIGFNTYVGQTRASIATLDQLETDGFCVFAAEHSDKYAGQPTTFMEEQMVVHKERAGETPGYWDYAPYRYWPVNDNMLSFFAYSPHQSGSDALIVPDNSTNFKLTYTTPAEPAKQIDLLYTYERNLTKANTGGAVHFQFDHILSKIGFAVYPKIELSDIMTMTVNKLSISYGDNVISKGSLPYGEQWVLDETAHFDSAVRHDIVTEDIAVLPEDEPTYDHVMTTRARRSTYTSMHPEGADNYLMLIPQPCELSSMTIYIEYTVVARESDGEGGYQDVASYKKSVTGTLPEAYINRWSRGTQYTYVIGLDMDLIEFGEPIISDWTTTPVEPEEDF